MTTRVTKKKKTGGRKPGTPNKVTSPLKEAARVYTLPALRVLVSIMRSKSALDMARVAAAIAVLDRGHGKPAQMHVGDEGGPIQVQTTVVHHHETVTP